VCSVILSSFKHGPWRTVFGVAAFLLLWYSTLEATQGQIPQFHPILVAFVWELT